MNEKEIYDDALLKWGPEAQINMAKEEAAELIQALCKFGREVNGSTINDVADEMADMSIMLEQLAIVFNKMTPGNFYAILENRRKHKLERLEELVNK